MKYKYNDFQLTELQTKKIEKFMNFVLKYFLIGFGMAFLFWLALFIYLIKIQPHP